MCVFLLVGTIFVKNYVLFGFFGSSSWMGMNMWRIAKHCHVTKLLKPEVALVRTFSHLSKYPEKYRMMPVAYSKIPVLVADSKKKGTVNLNHYAYIRISNDYLKESFHAISNDIPGYLKSVFQGWNNYSSPAWTYLFLEENRKKIQGYVDVFTFAKQRRFVEQNVFGISQNRGYPISSKLIVPAALIFMAIFFAIDFIRRIRRDDGQEYIYYGFMVMTIFYVAIIGTCFEYGENQRFRVQTDPLLYLATAIAIGKTYRNCKGKMKKTAD